LGVALGVVAFLTLLGVALGVAFLALLGVTLGVAFLTLLGVALAGVFFALFGVSAFSGFFTLLFGVVAPFFKAFAGVLSISANPSKLASLVVTFLRGTTFFSGVFRPFLTKGVLAFSFFALDIVMSSGDKA